MIHYVRVKIFTERGKEQHSSIEIPQFGRRNISDIAGRTLKADGSIIELKKDAIFDRELAKAKNAKLRGKTFVLPNVEVGDVVEYRYRETRDNESASYMRLYFQRDLPLWSVAYHLKPLSGIPLAMRTAAFQLKHPPIQKEPDGYYSMSASNIPAFKEEPYMPPEDQIRSWMLIYYEEDRKVQPDKFWKSLGQSDFSKLKPLMHVDDLVKRTTAEVISGADKPEAKLALIDTYCRTKIRNVNSPMSGKFIETRTGEALAEAAARYRGNSKTDYVKSIERWVGRSMQGAAATGIEIQDSDAAFVLQGKFASASFAQHPQAQMLIFRAALLDNYELRLTEKTRKYPIVVDADVLSESVKIQLPAEFKIDEIPPPVHLASEFGKFDASWTAESGTVIFKRTFELPAQTVPPSKYVEFKKFLDTVGGSSELPVVMIR